MRELNDWIKKIQEIFNDSNIELLSEDWDRNRFFDVFSSTFKCYSTVNNTDFNYSYCNSFDLKIPSSMIVGNYIITLKLSFILDVFVLFITSYSSDFRRGEVVSIEDITELNRIYRQVSKFAE